jgi:hypothetical protein
VEQISVKVPEALEILPNHRKYIVTIRDDIRLILKKTQSFTP